MDCYNKKKSRQRGDNWIQEEKDLFLEIMRQSAFIIENKKTDTNTNKKKYSEWLKVQSKFKKLTGKHRDIVQLKGFWRRYKLHAKKKLSFHKSAIQATGGGRQPEPLSQEDLKVINLCPTDLVVERNTFDSDRVYENMEKIDDCASDTQEKHNSTNYDTELNEDEDMDEVETVINVNNIGVHLHKENRAEQNNDFNEKIRTHPPRRKYQKTENSHKGIILLTNIDLKKRRRELMEEEHALKIKYQKQEISHQHQRHKLEIAILLLEKEKKELELKKIKKSFQ